MIYNLKIICMILKFLRYKYKIFWVYINDQRNSITLFVKSVVDPLPPKSPVVYFPSLRVWKIALLIYSDS